MPNDVRKFMSGGQTGVDRAALDFALSHGLEIGGYVPKGRLAEDGRISDEYPGLIETESADTSERTRLNVVGSDATLIISHGRLMGGSELTRRHAEEYSKPVLHIDLKEMMLAESAGRITEWLRATGCETLNIAGPRASEDPDIYESVIEILSAVFPGK